MVYYKPEDITEQAFTQFKILTYIKNILLLIAWFVSSTSSGVSLSDIELEPDADDDQDKEPDSDEGDSDGTIDE